MYVTHCTFSPTDSISISPTSSAIPPGYDVNRSGKGNVQWNCNSRRTVHPKKYAHGFCFAVLCCGYTLIFPYPSGLLHWHCGNLTIAPVPAKQPWWIWINTSCEFIMNDCITTTKQSTTKPCAYFLGYTVENCSCRNTYPLVMRDLSRYDISYHWTFLENSIN